MIKFILEQLQLFAKQQGDKPTVNLVIPLKKIDLLSFLKGQSTAQHSIYPAIYWQDKEQQQTIVCLGKIEECQHIPSPSQHASYFGGLAFQQHGQQWTDFPDVRFIRPALEFKLENQVMTLTCHFNGKYQIDQMIAYITRLQPPTTLSNIKNKVNTRIDSPNKIQWADLVERAIEYKALIPKVVLSRQTELNCTREINHIDLLNQWQRANPSSFHFSFQFSPEHAFIGCSPERLFKRKNQHLITEALAGTINRGRNEREDKLLLQSLLTDKKIDRENYLVQEFIISNLKQLKAQVTNKETYVMQLQHVQHLCVPINATLTQQTTDSQLLYRLHPTPAVGGSPKQPALQFIDDNEPYRRGWYAGTVGYLRKDNSDFSVAIRCALVSQKKVKLFAGAGIVTGSIASQEWQELDNKIETILEIINDE